MSANSLVVLISVVGAVAVVASRSEKGLTDFLTTDRSVTYRFIGRQKPFRETIVSAVAKTLCRVTLDNLRGIIYEWEIFLRTTNRNSRLSPRSSRLRKSDIFNRVREPGLIDRRRRFNSRDLSV